jgi:hypothetical protein
MITMLRVALLFCGVLLAFSIMAGAEPEIWFAPEDSIRREQRGDPWKGDFMALFPADAPWQKAAARVQIFEIYPQFLSRASDDTLRAVFEGLKRRNIALAISYGMLHRPKGAEMHEGYGAEIAGRDIARLKRLGADVRYIVADEPLLFGHFFWGVGAPPLPIAELAKDFVSTARQFREAFPEARIGMDDPIMLYKDQEWAPAMREFLAAYKNEFGEPMGFVRLECASFQIREWLPRYISAAELFRSLGVGFGVLITGDASDTSDEQWLAKAEERYVVWESDGRPAPAQVVFQSWMPRPSKILPETAPDTHTHLVNGYFRERTSLAATLGSNGLHARLTEEQGRPVSGAPVAFTILPGFDDLAMIHRTIKGTVPEGAQSVQVGLRIGIEGSREGAARLALGPTRYCEAGDGGQSAVFGFEHGLKEWGTKGDASAEPKSGAGAEDSSLEIAVSAGQTFLLNSKKTPGTAGRDFTFDFDARARPENETGYLVVFFFDTSRKVILRIAEPLVPENPRLVQNLVTDREGAVEIPFSSPDLKSAREIRLTYPGDERRRPAFARLQPKP